MDNNDLEKKLKESAGKIEMKDFSIRLASINEKLKTQEQNTEKVLCEEAVLLSPSESISIRSSKKTKFSITIAAVFGLLVAIVLAIVLPITLRKDKTRFFTMNEISVSFLGKEEFYDAVESSNLNIIDLTDWDVDNYRIIYSPDGDVVGGGFEVNDDKFGIYLIASFYGSNIITEFTIEPDYIELNVGNAKISYKTTYDETFNTFAIINLNNIKYTIDCMSIEDNFVDLIQQLFV